MARNVAQTSRIDRSTELFRLADIRHLYGVADVFEKDVASTARGRKAKARWNGRMVEGEIADALPLYDAGARTFKLRVRGR